MIVVTKQALNNIIRELGELGANLAYEQRVAMKNGANDIVAATADELTVLQELVSVCEKAQQNNKPITVYLTSV